MTLKILQGIVNSNFGGMVVNGRGVPDQNNPFPPNCLKCAKGNVS